MAAYMLPFDRVTPIVPDSATFFCWRYKISISWGPGHRPCVSRQLWAATARASLHWGGNDVLTVETFYYVIQLWISDRNLGWNNQPTSQLTKLCTMRQKVQMVWLKPKVLLIVSLHFQLILQQLFWYWHSTLIVNVRSSATVLVFSTWDRNFWDFRLDGHCQWFQPLSSTRKGLCWAPRM